MSFQATLTLIGGPTVIIDIAGFRLVTDPTFDEPGIYSAGAVTLEKTGRPALTPTEIGAVDAVLLSHDQHFDNLDHAGRDFLKQASTTVTTILGAGRLGGNAVGLAPWQGERLQKNDGRGLHVTAAPARHGPRGIEPITGQVIGFLLGIEQPGDAIYITDDTVWYEGVAEVSRRYAPAIVITCAGAAQTRGRFQLTMNCNDAIETAHAFQKSKIVGVHNEGWRHFTESEEDLKNAFNALGLAERLISLEPGRPKHIVL